MEPERLRIALTLDQQDLLRPVQAVQPIEDRAEAFGLLVPEHTVVALGAWLKRGADSMPVQLSFGCEVWNLDRGPQAQWNRILSCGTRAARLGR
jgi:hypothetical protein